jgi:hypothetical protein
LLNLILFILSSHVFRLCQQDLSIKLLAKLFSVAITKATFDWYSEPEDDTWNFALFLFTF